MKTAPVPDPAGQKSTDPTGSGSSSLDIPKTRIKNQLTVIRFQDSPKTWTFWYNVIVLFFTLEEKDDCRGIYYAKYCSGGGGDGGKERWEKN